jgi:hypothetical protein
MFQMLDLPKEFSPSKLIFHLKSIIRTGMILMLLRLEFVKQLATSDPPHRDQSKKIAKTYQLHSCFLLSFGNKTPHHAKLETKTA